MILLSYFLILLLLELSYVQANYNSLGVECVEVEFPCVWLYREPNKQPAVQGPVKQGYTIDCEDTSDSINQVCMYNLYAGVLIGCGGYLKGIKYEAGQGNIYFDGNPSDFIYSWRHNGNLVGHGIDNIDITCNV